MITHQRNVYKWDFVFLGANIDAVETAASLGVSPQMARTYTASADGCRSTYTVMNKLLSYMKMNDAGTDAFEDDCEEILAEIQ